MKTLRSKRNIHHNFNVSTNNNSSFLSNHDLLENFRNKSFKLITRDNSVTLLNKDNSVNQLTNNITQKPINNNNNNSKNHFDAE